MSENIELAQTKQWLEQVIIGLNFCPFAKKEFVNNTIYYHKSVAKNLKKAVAELAEQLDYLANNPAIETSLVVYSEGFKDFHRFLSLVDLANDLVVELGYEGIFQIANFHPEYCFEGEDFDDASNYTNRSPYPTLHLIREQSMDRVLKVYQNPEQIPDNNIALARAKGNDYFHQLLIAIKAK